MSFSTAFRRSSNSPRYFAPASSAAMSSDSTRLPLSVSGTSPLTMRCASPSTIAVLPTPGSPISTGLFFVRRWRIWIVRRISSSRPLTGSSFPSRARSVRSIVYFLSASRWPSASAESTPAPPRTASIAVSSALRVRPASFSRRPMSPLSSAAASRKSSLAMNWSPRLVASLSVRFSRLLRSRETAISPQGSHQTRRPVQDRKSTRLNSSHLGISYAVFSLKKEKRDYAQAMIHAARPDISVSEVEKRVRVRMSRQSLLSQDDPIDLWVVLDEAVLRRPVGGKAVMRRQLEHLNLAAGWPNVTLQVLPFSAGAHAGMDGTFTMLLYDESAGQNFVFASNAAGGLFLEKDDELLRYGFIFDYLRANALRPDESVSLFAKLTKEL